MIEIWTDGACSGNPGRGGYGILMRDASENYEKQFSQGFEFTTNNRMELLAVIIALENLKKNNLEVIIYTDSKYVSDAINKRWINKWVSKKFVGVKNPDLWKRLVVLLEEHKVRFRWVRGHAGNKENEIVDALAVNAYLRKDLIKDTGY